MILKTDAKQLEWRVKLFQSQDPVGIQEVIDKVDAHGENQKRFNLPERVIAKIFLFRWIFRGPAYAYANDPDFMAYSDSTRVWQKVIDEANAKYKGIPEHHAKQDALVRKQGYLDIDSGRRYYFKQRINGGEVSYSDFDVANWPTQGLSADIMVITRLITKQKLGLYNDRIKYIATVHDDIENDVDNDPELLYHSSMKLLESFEETPFYFKKYFGKEFNVPLAGEVSFGPNLKEQTEFRPELGPDQFLEAMK